MLNRSARRRSRWVVGRVCGGPQAGGRDKSGCGREDGRRRSAAPTHDLPTRSCTFAPRRPCGYGTRIGCRRTIGHSSTSSRARRPDESLETPDSAFTGSSRVESKESRGTSPPARIGRGDNGGVNSLDQAISARALCVGREVELEALDRFVGSEGPEPALVLVGEAGIGKTTLWLAGVELARERGRRIVQARASAGEERLSFAGLADLLDGLDLVSFALPVSQSRALEIALGRADPIATPPELLTVFVGFLGVLRSLASRGQLLVAVDDVGSLDAESSAAIVFAARRLDDPDVRFLFSSRGDLPSGLDDAFGPAGLVRRDVPALSFGAVTFLLAERLGSRLPRRVMHRVFETSRGNPLFALELGRAIVERGIPEIGQPLPLTDVLDDVFAERVSGLAGPVRRALLVVVLGAGATRTELDRAADPSALEDAIASGVLVAEDARLRPAHPLLSTAALRAAGGREQREIHLALAHAAADPLLRVRHLARATEEPDEQLSADLAAAAMAASERGAVEDAVELASQALRLTETGASERGERLLELVRCLQVAGGRARATELLASAIETLPAGRLRAVAHLLASRESESGEEAGRHLELAIAESAGDPELLSWAFSFKAVGLAVGRLERIEEAQKLAEEAVTLSRSVGDEAEARALSALVWARILRGRSIDELREDARTTPGRASVYESSFERPAAVQLAFRGDVLQARAAFARLLALAEERGEARSTAAMHLQLCELALRAGEAREAARLLEEWDYWFGFEPEKDSRLRRARLEALLAAIVGVPERVEQALEVVAEMIGSFTRLTWDRIEAERGSGIAALLQHDSAGAMARFRAIWEHTVREGIDDPGAFPVAADLIEAMAESGELDGVEQIIDRLRTLSVAQQHPWGLATAARCAAVVELTRGYDDQAAAALTDAAAAYGELGLGFDRARSLLFLGRVQRRSRKRAEARRSLHDAVKEFERLGCDGWAEEARVEHSRVSGRRPGSDHILTPGERRVAELAAAGLANKEIAARLFVSVYTVETHLKSCYAKLGIRSRTQLANRLGEES